MLEDFYPWSLQLFASVVIFYLTSIIVYRLYFHPLAGFPGPRLAAVTRWYEAYYDVVKDGQYTWKLAELHTQYGPIIRISPCELHVNDPTFYEQLYRHDGHWNKYAWSYDAFGNPSATVTTVDHTIHRKRRAPLSLFFSKQAVAKRLEAISYHIDKLRDCLIQSASEGTPVNIGNSFSAMTIDISTEYVLGRSYNNLNHADYNTPMIDIIKSLGGLWRITKHFRFIDPLFKAIPLSWLEKTGDPKSIALVSYLKDVEKTVKRLMSEHLPKTIDGSSPPNVIDVILESKLSAADKEFPRLYDETLAALGAGFETVAASLRLTVYYIYQNPQILARLRGELHKQIRNLPPGQTKLDLMQLEQVPYLTAVIMEGLRLSPGVSTRLARVAPDRDLVYAEKWLIPAGTPVGMTALLMHLDERVYENARTFDPDRWVGQEYGQGDLSKTFAAFSRGTRKCAGMPLAWTELYLTLSMIVLTFDLDLLDTSAADVDAYSDQFVIGCKSRRGLRATLSLA